MDGLHAQLADQFRFKRAKGTLTAQSVRVHELFNSMEIRTRSMQRHLRNRNQAIFPAYSKT
ncbi:MAG: hypothetical protein CMO80_08800 [Verrucomicrobiales bacterium]|nr:hypothetical protein [Verrucomicrobiales bacterium]